MATSKTPPKAAIDSPRNLDDLLNNTPPRPPRPPQAAVSAPIASPVAQIPRNASKGQAVKMTFNLTPENERGLSQLSYWRRGSKASKTWILNQALAEYLSRYPDSQREIPVDDDE
ncbi:MAG: hypothetical protein EOO61_11320 [Hymenobacter sp.]|nr:MAG: hypothetical protein EOO61_11320 [Hymenobacter sp.]